MGSFFSSYSIPADVHRETQQLLSAWLGAKGFEEVDEPQLMELDDTSERGVLIYWSDHWTIVLYSNFDEEPRLQFELKKLEEPLLHLWLHDSSLWGYELIHEEETVSAFNSNPRYFGVSQEVDGPNDIEAVCRLCRVPGQEFPIKKLQGKRAVFRDEICRDFARLLGASPAASCYRYIQEEPEEAETHGFNERHLRFRSHGWNPMENFHLQEIIAKPRSPQPRDQGWENLKDTLGEEEAMRMQKQFQRAQAVSGCITVLFKPLAWIVGGMFRLSKTYQNISRSIPGTAAGTSPGAAQFPEHLPFRIEGDYLINDRHRCRIKLVEGAAAAENFPILSQISTVFAFAIGDMQVICSAMWPKQVEQMLTNWPTNSEIKEENRTINNLPVKSLSVYYQTNQVNVFQEFHFLQAPRAIYVFSASSNKKLADEICSTLRDTVDSFEMKEAEIS